MRRLAISVLLMAASLSAVASDPFIEGVAAYAKGDYAAALAPLTDAGEAGDAEAQYLLGKIHLDGLAGRADAGEALAWLERAVANRHREAAQMLGNMYSAGLGVPRDPEKAAEYMELAAKLMAPGTDDEDCD